ncbi:polysaccharide deacetylase family protein [Acholeplasma sp. OttesenSCG-928-E16]|nr:polysaccharide deacetylase family protein [Acholeplasma sp. OttesenSCG-928-E16]
MENREALRFGNRDNNNVCMMINIYWGTEIVDKMLAVLREKNVKTTFFIVGEWGADNHEMLRKIVAEGHELGNHGYHHKDHDTLTYQENQEEILLCHNLIKDVTGIEMTLFAPPSGAYDDITLKAAEDLGYLPIMWTKYKDTIDWRDKEEQLAFDRATQNILGGDLILMHPMEHTLAALPKIIDFYRSVNINPTTVSETVK